MAVQLTTNNAKATLASGIASGATSLTLATGKGALFPALSGGDWFVLTLTQALTETSWEIVKVTARSGDVLTIVRAQEGTTAAAWAAADKAELRITAGLVNRLATLDDAQTLDAKTLTGVPRINGGATSGLKEKIINGRMEVSQYNGTTSVTPADRAYPIDRWKAWAAQASKFSTQQVTTAPTGFINSLKITSLSSYTLLANDYFSMNQVLEGINVADLAWGTASALPVTLSFYVYSSLTGTFGASVCNDAGTRSYPFSYTISAANTWQKISVLIPGETTGSWVTTTSGSLRLQMGLGVGTTYSGTANAWASTYYVAPTGATSVVSTNGATFYFTGVSLKAGDCRNELYNEWRPYALEEMLCQRYYYRKKPGTTGALLGGTASAWSTTLAFCQGSFPAPMRIAPTALEQSGTAGDYAVLAAGSTIACNVVPVFNQATTTDFQVALGVASGLTAGWACHARTSAASGANAYLGWSAEL